MLKYFSVVELLDMLSKQSGDLNNMNENTIYQESIIIMPEPPKGAQHWKVNQFSKMKFCDVGKDFNYAIKTLSAFEQRFTESK